MWTTQCPEIKFAAWLNKETHLNKHFFSLLLERIIVLRNNSQSIVGVKSSILFTFLVTSSKALYMYELCHFRKIVMTTGGYPELEL